MIIHFGTFYTIFIWKQNPLFLTFNLFNTILFALFSFVWTFCQLINWLNLKRDHLFTLKLKSFRLRWENVSLQTSFSLSFLVCQYLLSQSIFVCSHATLPCCCFFFLFSLLSPPKPNPNPKEELIHWSWEQTQRVNYTTQ